MSEYIYKYNIAGVGIELNSDFPIKSLQNIPLFEADPDSFASGAVIRVCEAETIVKPHAAPAFSSNYVESFPNPSGCVMIRKHPRTGEAFAAFGEGNSANEYVLAVKSNELANEAVMHRILLYAGLPHILLQKGRLMLHASYISSASGGVVFAAASGVGKSTQARLWEEYAGAETVNGDRAVMWLTDDKSEVMVGSMPFCGTSAVCKNIDTRLCAVALPVQASENRLVRLNGVKAIKAIIENAVIEDWRSGEANAAAALVCEIVERIPVYRLYCRIDEQAVRILEEALKHETHK